ncbi:hypothetical protein SDC9_95588 [bioreactor metagenome]|uniref:Uncharacterized protein n=1 Tax=bioreactor metagenome TaxID=1076179 RepID=A0A645A9A7_9ZZZZ
MVKIAIGNTDVNCNGLFLRWIRITYRVSKFWTDFVNVAIHQGYFIRSRRFVPALVSRSELIGAIFIDRIIHDRTVSRLPVRQHN